MGDDDAVLPLSHEQNTAVPLYITINPSFFIGTLVVLDSELPFPFTGQSSQTDCSTVPRKKLTR